MRLPPLLGVVLLAAALGGCAGPPYSNAGNDQVKALLAQGLPIYDIRRPEEWRLTGVVEDSHALTFVDAGGRAT